MICESCEQPIERMEDAWGEWFALRDTSDSNGRMLARRFRIVHHFTASPRNHLPEGCYYEKNRPLDENGDKIFVMDTHLRSILFRGRKLLKDYTFDDPIAVLEKMEAAQRELGPKPQKAKPARPKRAKGGRRKGSRRWSDDDPVGLKRQRLVKWLMSKPRRVPLDEAKLIAVRKYPE